MCRKGFTLAELLIALLILGVIATFTIPKVLQSQQSSKWNSMAKEMVGMISGAYQAYSQDNTVGSNFSAAGLTPYFNYIATDNTVTIDGPPGGLCSPTIDCSDGDIDCFKMHNGGMIAYNNTETFSGTTSINGVQIVFDPSGTFTNDLDAVDFILFYNGRLSAFGFLNTGYTSSFGAAPPNACSAPSWFSWN